jgi:plastocyanin
VDTVAVGGTVTWTWGANSAAYGGHSVQSVGAQSFASSAVQSNGTYSLTFTAPGTYQYDCAVHGTAMTGTVVVR